MTADRNSFADEGGRAILVRLHLMVEKYEWLHPVSISCTHVANDCLWLSAN